MKSSFLLMGLMTVVSVMLVFGMFGFTNQEGPLWHSNQDFSVVEHTNQEMHSNQGCVLLMDVFGFTNQDGPIDWSNQDCPNGV